MSDHQVRVAVLVVALNKGKVVLARRANTTYMDGYYGLPGGHLEEGESLVQAAQRELLEETGLTSTGKLELFQVYHNTTTPNRPYIGFIFKTHEGEGKLRLEEDKADDIQTFDIDNLPENIIPYHREAILDASKAESIKINYIPHQG